MNASTQKGSFANGQMHRHTFPLPWAHSNFASRPVRVVVEAGGTFASTYAVVVYEPGFGHSCA